MEQYLHSPVPSWHGAYVKTGTTACVDTASSFLLSEICHSTLYAAAASRVDKRADN